jgi:hypothetical protein
MEISFVTTIKQWTSFSIATQLWGCLLVAIKGGVTIWSSSNDGNKFQSPFFNIDKFLSPSNN